MPEEARNKHLKFISLVSLVSTSALASIKIVVGLIAGLISGGLIGGLLQPQIANIHLTVEQFSTVLTFIFLWIIDSFLR